MKLNVTQTLSIALFQRSIGKERFLQNVAMLFCEIMIDIKLFYIRKNQFLILANDDTAYVDLDVKPMNTRYLFICK